MEVDAVVDTAVPMKDEMPKKKIKTMFSLRYLRKSLKYRPEILKFILKMKQCNRKQFMLLKKFKEQMKLVKEYLKMNSMNPENVEALSKTSADQVVESHTDTTCAVKVQVADTSTQTDPVTIADDKILTDCAVVESASESTEAENVAPNEENEVKEKGSAGWDIGKSDNEGKSIADQVKEAAQSALQQSGMVYVESAGMYYDYKTGYYYNTELGLYYHTTTGCYYSYSEDKKEFAFHSYPDQRVANATASLEAHEKRKARKQKKEPKKEDIDSLTKNFSKDTEDEAPKPKKKKKSNKKRDIQRESDKNDQNVIENQSENSDKNVVTEVTDVEMEDREENGNVVEKEDLEDGECSETESEDEEDDLVSNASTSTASDEGAVAKHHPPCMRVIVRETTLPKLRVGTLFLVTKDGGTLGREGDHHAIVIRDNNVSRNHLEITYDMAARMYFAKDLGSKNGTILNGVPMSQSQVVGELMEVVHGSTIQLGETKLLCHIHAGNDTCGHCEPGLIMETQQKVQAAYTRTCSVQKQHQLELARLKNKYSKELPMIEDGTYNDRAKARRDTVGSSHHSEKTQTTDVETFIEPENKGFKLLEKMGWSKGEGLGKDNQGETEPIPLVSNEGKAGLGTPGAVAAPAPAPPRKKNQLGSATLRLAARSKLLHPPAKAFQDPLDDDIE